jgi:phosphoribosylaminoimidazole-succinocarboxamide synthase
MDRQTIDDFLDRTIRETRYTDLGERYQGKVRDTYRHDDRLVLVTTDRISAFDHVLPQAIPFKGQILNQTAAYFFEATSDLVPNHVLEVPDPNVTVATACDPVPVEFVVRGYLEGQAWRQYDRGKRSICGKPLPAGLKQGSRLPEPILTPATKAESGHDENVTREETIGRGLVSSDVFDQLESYALALFKRGTEMAEERGLLLVDTKYEFGKAPGGEYVLIDEVHTPDCSRYYYADGYQERLESGEPQRQLSKEFVREWLMDQGFQGKDGQRVPDLPDDLRASVTERYVELYEQVTGTAFGPDLHPDPVFRIHDAVSDYAVA